MPPPTPDNVAAILAAVQQSAKYRDVCPELIARLAARESATSRNLKEAVKATKNALHQIAGAYLDSRPRYAEWLDEFAACADDRERFRDACLRRMQAHASTRERLPFLSEFYTTLLADLAPVRSVLDVACGLNPLALPWMPLVPDAVYHACDLYGDMMAFLDRFLPLAGVAGHAQVCDVVASPPTQQAEVAFVLKLLPVLDQQERAAGLTLLRALNARTLLVSFPTRSLGGRGKGMAENYATRFHTLVQEEPWQITPYDFPTELCFRITKP